VPVILVGFERILNHLDRFFKNIQISAIENFRPVGADEQTDMAKLIVAFHNFAKARKNNPELTTMAQLFIIMMNYGSVLE
jgi:hypothetical protein